MECTDQKQNLEIGVKKKKVGFKGTSESIYR